MCHTSQVTRGLSNLAMKLLGPTTLVQGAIPDILSKVPPEYHQRNLALFHTNATLCCELLRDAPGLTPIRPKGTMYIMVSAMSKALPCCHSPSLPAHAVSCVDLSFLQVVIDLDHFPEFDSDVAFMRKLVLEQSVFCLPGVVREREYLSICGLMKFLALLLICCLLGSPTTYLSPLKFLASLLGLVPGIRVPYDDL